MTAPVDAKALELRSRAAVLVDFDLADLVSDDDDVDVVLDFVEDCDKVFTPEGAERWSLRDATRPRILSSVPLSRLRKYLPKIRPTTALQRALDQSLAKGWSDKDLNKLKLDDALALAVVAGWWDSANPMVPAPQTIAVQVERTRMFSDARAMASDHFVGRVDVLSELERHFRGGAGPFVISGLGGVGKSAVVARHVVWALDKANAAVVTIDFDDPTLNPKYSVDIVSHMLDLLERQHGFGQSELGSLRRHARDIAEKGRYGANYQGRQLFYDERSDWNWILDEVARLERSPILVVMDTFEQVQRRGPAAISSTVAVIEELCARANKFRVVISGRAEIPELANAINHPLLGLSRTEAIELLSAVSGVRIAQESAAAVIDLVGTSPLTVRLAAHLLGVRDGEPGELFAMDFAEEQIDAVLYRRVLAHIVDEDVRKLAHPGLVLRRITSQIIERVLAKPCGVELKSVFSADALFDKMSNEAMLFDRSRDNRTLIHRADIRQVMLPPLLRDRPDDAHTIQVAAIRYYVGINTPEAKIEELYHRLLIGQSRTTLDERWDSTAAEALAPVADEFPDASRRYLMTRLPSAYLSKDDLKAVNDADWVAKTEPQVVRLLSTGDIKQALTLIQSRRDAGGRSLLPGLEIEALEASGRYKEAIDLSRAQLRQAADQSAISDVVVYTLHLSRLLDHASDADGARQVLADALEKVREPTLERLRLLVAWLGLTRRHGNDVDGSQARKQEAIELRKAVGARAIRTVPGLLRDLAAEVGAEDAEVLQDALRTVGMDANVDGAVPNALEALANKVAEEPGVSTEFVADLARLDHSGGSIFWPQIVEMPRSDTGLGLSDVLSNFGESAQGLGNAITLDYQSEADNAYLNRYE